jgi:hypothetical protein
MPLNNVSLAAAGWNLLSVATSQQILTYQYTLRVGGRLLYEFGFASLEFFLARHTAKMVGFALISDFVFGRVFV